MTKKVKVGLVGFGTVGSGVAKILVEQRAVIAAKTGIDIDLDGRVGPQLSAPGLAGR